MTNKEKDVKALGELFKAAGFNGGRGYKEAYVAHMVDTKTAHEYHGHHIGNPPTRLWDFQRLLIARYYASNRKPELVQLEDIRESVKEFPVRPGAKLQIEVDARRAEIARLQEEKENLVSRLEQAEAEITRLRAASRASTKSLWSRLLDSTL